jgi:hypothetical protein
VSLHAAVCASAAVSSLRRPLACDDPAVGLADHSAIAVVCSMCRRPLVLTAGPPPRVPSLAAEQHDGRLRAALLRRGRRAPAVAGGDHTTSVHRGSRRRSGAARDGSDETRAAHPSDGDDDVVGRRCDFTVDGPSTLTPKCALAHAEDRGRSHSADTLVEQCTLDCIIDRASIITLSLYACISCMLIHFSSTLERVSAAHSPSAASLHTARSHYHHVTSNQSHNAYDLLFLIAY